MSPTRSLITAEELAGMLGTVTVLDVRYRMGGRGPSGRAAFAAGHVPTAAYVDLDTALAAPPGAGGRHPLPEPEEFAAAMRAAGVRRGRPVVVYDDWSGHAAARCWWLLRYHGHADVRVLDGAWPVWVASGGPVEAGPGGPVEQGDFVADPGHLPVVDADGVRAVDVVVDARAPERWRGETEPVDPVAGRIPGAVNVPTSRNLADDGRFRDAAELRSAYADVGALEGGSVAVYCGSGVTAAHDVLALDLLGVRAALYPGSWSGWITDPDRPVERG